MIATTHSWVIEVNITNWGTITDDTRDEAKNGWWFVPIYRGEIKRYHDPIPYIPKKANGDEEDYEPVFTLALGMKILKEVQTFRTEEVYRLRNLFDGTIIMGDAV